MKKLLLVPIMISFVLLSVPYTMAGDEPEFAEPSGTKGGTGIQANVDKVTEGVGKAEVEKDNLFNQDEDNTTEDIDNIDK